jgi:hypothetical protein
MPRDNEVYSVLFAFRPETRTMFGNGFSRRFGTRKYSHSADHSNYKRWKHALSTSLGWTRLAFVRARISVARPKPIPIVRYMEMKKRKQNIPVIEVDEIEADSCSASEWRHSELRPISRLHCSKLWITAAKTLR